MNIEYAIIVKSKTRLEQLIERFNTESQAKFYVERLGGNFRDYQIEHDNFYRALDLLQSGLSRIIKNKVLDKSYLPSFIFSKNQMILVIGQDGLVANTAKYSKGIPMVAVNPDRERYDGVLLPYDTSSFHQGVINVLENNFAAEQMSFAEAKLNDGQSLLAFNDLFIGAQSHVSARYKINFNKKEEEQSSSGIIVSTKAGATGWLSSIFNMAYGLTNSFNTPRTFRKPELNPNQLLFAVREPFKSIKTSAEIVTGFVSENKCLSIESFMPNNGVIFSDGIESDYIKFNSGAKVTIGVSSDTALLIKPKQAA